VAGLLAPTPGATPSSATTIHPVQPDGTTGRETSRSAGRIDLDARGPDLLRSECHYPVPVGTGRQVVMAAGETSISGEH